MGEREIRGWDPMGTLGQMEEKLLPLEQVRRRGREDKPRLGLLRLYFVIIILDGLNHILCKERSRRRSEE